LFGVEAPYGVYTFTTNYLGALTSKNLARIPDCESWLSVKFTQMGFHADFADKGADGAELGLSLSVAKAGFQLSSIILLS